MPFCLARWPWTATLLALDASLRALSGSSLAAQPVTHSAATEYESEHGAIRVELIVEGLRNPSAMVFVAPNRAVVAERGAGRLSLLDLASGVLTPIAGTPPALTGLDAGMCDVVLHPDFATNGILYFAYAEGTEDRSTTVIARGRLEGARLSEVERVFVADAYAEDRNHYGVRLLFEGDFLYATIGDRHHERTAQQMSSHAGKVVRLNADGSAPANGPFAEDAQARAEIWTFGHRNPQGIAVHPVTRDIWIHEHGPLAGDELNRLRAGANYGWPIVSYGWQYDGGPIGKGIVTSEGIEAPVWVWTPAIAPSGMFFYSGTAFPAWRGDIVLGSLARRGLVRLVLRGHTVVAEERLIGSDAGRVRLVAQDADGFIYFGNDDGRVYRVRPGR